MGIWANDVELELDVVINLFKERVVKFDSQKRRPNYCFCDEAPVDSLPHLSSRLDAPEVDEAEDIGGNGRE